MAAPATDASASRYNAWLEYLKTVPVNSLVPKEGFRLLTVAPEATVEDVVKLFEKHHILSAPVKDMDTHTYLGLVDVLDLANFCVEEFGTRRVDEIDTLHQERVFSTKKVKEIIDISARDPWVPVSDSASMLSLMQILADPDIHRVPIVSKDGRRVALITQSSVLQFLHAHRQHYPELSAEPLSASSLGFAGTLHTLEGHNPTFRAFQMMRKEGVSAVGIVDAEGRLMGNISASDLRGFTPGRMVKALYTSLSRFLGDKPVHSVTASNTLGEVIEKLVTNHIHRVWVVADDGKPIGVVSLCDIIDHLSGYQWTKAQELSS